MAEEKIKNLFQITTDRMYTALEAFYVWRKMNQMMNINAVGEEKAKSNVGVLQKYWDFFHPVLVSTYKSFVTDLAIFFDTNKFEETFSLSKMIEEVKTRITKEQYDDLMQKISEIKKKHGVTIGLVLELRNAEVSHQEINKKQRFIVYKDIEELFEATQEILNLLSKYYNDSHTMWSHLELPIVGTVDWVIENLERGEKVRLQEVSDRYRI